ncbi:HD domain-containing protein [Heliorestis acidaminivorans]|uniref:HD domain-containing protein n=1 Tax=Heliorestis acidaminivorans TaxID=553427 RepID=A0A6I0F5S9_9FIRM|nr:HD domain-containing protein [Heliorestis acidaminivorans]KAB2954187.1 HD domain-containing protein [Heliorestis acidaminivorans]
MKTAFSKIIYRGRQVYWALKSNIKPEEVIWAKNLLNPNEYAIFTQLSRADRRHSLDVAWLCANSTHLLSNEERTLLLKSALLHDMGKRHYPLQLWHRIVYVLLQNHPWWLKALKEKSSLGKALWVMAQHSNLGAEEAAQLNWSPDLVALIRHHHDRQVVLSEPLDKLIGILQSADEKS